MTMVMMGLLFRSPAPKISRYSVFPSLFLKCMYLLRHHTHMSNRGNLSRLVSGSNNDMDRVAIRRQGDYRFYVQGI